MSPRPSPRARTAICTLALLLTPVLHGLSFPPFELPLLAWVAFVPWFAAIRLVGPWTALGITSLTTFAGSTVVASWLPRAVATYYGQPLALGVGIFVGVWAVTVAPFVLAFTLAYRALGRQAGPALPLLAGAAWTANEIGRVELLVGNPFGLLGYTQARLAPMVQVAELTGVYGLGFAIAAVNAALAELWLARAGAGRPAQRAWQGLGLAVGVATLALSYGLLRLATEPAAPVDGRATRVAVAQANLDLGSQWRQDLYGRNLEEYLRLTVQALRASDPALVVWPESAMTFFLETEPAYRSAIARVLAPSGTELLAGGPRQTDERKPRYWNSAFLLSPTGDIVARYDKQVLLPFAEYFPFASIELLRREFARVREFAPGGPAALLPTVAGRAGIVICNEAMFPRLVRARVRAGAEVLVNLSNDSWLGDVQYSEQAFDMTRLRAVEQRRWVVRASTSGPSALIDPAGRIAAATAPSTRAELWGTIEARDALTLYARVGDAFAYGCLAAVLLAVAAGTYAERRARGSTATGGGGRLAGSGTRSTPSSARLSAR